MERDTEIVDYAYPTMMAEKALKEMHSAVLAQNYKLARQQASAAVQWTTEAYAALIVMERSWK